MRLLKAWWSLALLLLAPLATGNPLQGVFGPENLKKAERLAVELVPDPEEDFVTLKFSGAETPGSFLVPLPPAAADWTRFAAFAFEFSSSSTIRWELQLRNRKGEVLTYRVQPLQDVTVRAAIPMSFFTRDYMNNRQFKGYWLSNWGGHIDMTQIDSLAVRMNPNQPVTLRLGRLTLTAGAVSDEILIDKPVVDEFGQWAPLTWPGKVYSLDQLRRAWKSEDDKLTRTEDFGYSRYGGWRDRRQRSTGFFHTLERDGRWWLVDPDGYLFFSAGLDCVRYREPSRAAGREKLFAKLPPGAGESVDFYRANATLRYGEASFIANWKRTAERRLKAWGFNTVANWSDPALFEQPAIPFVTGVSIGRSARNWQGFPDVYSPEFLATAETDAQEQCRKFRQERLLIGYFIGNEPRWHQRGLLQSILKDPEPSETQNFVRRFLKDQGDTAASRDALLETITRKYFRTVCQAIRRADPNHLILGIRWAGGAPDPVLRANDAFDVFSINIYRFAPPADLIERIHSLVRRPILIGEFHFGAPERGYAPALVMVRDQNERGVAFQYYVERAAAFPAVVGAHYFQLCDQPVTGRFDGENYNLGFVSQQDLPYPQMVFYAKAAHHRLYRVHAGDILPTDRQAKVR